MFPSFLGWIMILYTGFLALVAGLGLLVEPTGRMYMWIARVLWGKHVLSIGNIRLVTVGGQDVDPQKTYVVCANHASQLDIPALFGALHFPIRFLAKRSLFYIPLLGWSMWLARFVPVDRGRGKKSRESLEKAAKRIRSGPSVMVFPEGTRSADGKLGNFKSGAFALAQKAGVPVVPVAIRGAWEVLPKKCFRHRPGTIEVIVGHPIAIEGKEMVRLKKEVKSAIATMQETGEPV